MGLFRRTPRRTEQLPAPVDPNTLAGAAQLGNDGGSGMVPGHRAFTDTDAGGRADMLGHDVIPTTATLDAVRTPESWYADRPLHGGVRTSPHFGQYIEEPGNTGGHGIVVGSPPVIITDPRLMPVVGDPVPSFRDVPTPEVCRRVPMGGAR